MCILCWENRSGPLYHPHLVSLLSSPGLFVILTCPLCCSYLTEFQSQRRFSGGIFTSTMKLMKGFSAGIVGTVFLTSISQTSTEKQMKTHDEIDFEFLGNVEPSKIILATNIFAGGKGLNENEEGVS